MSHILIVEDEDFLERALRDNLSLESLKTEVAKDGEEALKKLRKATPALVLLDLLLPKKDGFEVLAEMKKDPALRLIPVIILSNLGNDTDLKRAFELGANDYFVKSQHPITEIIEKIKEYAEGGRRSPATP